MTLSFGLSEPRSPASKTHFWLQTSCLKRQTERAPIGMASLQSAARRLGWPARCGLAAFARHAKKIRGFSARLSFGDQGQMRHRRRNDRILACNP